MPSNFRTYEAQSRLLAAVIASTPTIKLNFKAIALHYGSDTTDSSIDHRLRSIKKQAAVIRRAVAEGTDAKNAIDLFYMNDKDIHKYFGESTPMGIEFQFRTIRKEAKALRDAVDKGESPLATRRAAASPTVRMSPFDGSARKRKAPVGSGSRGARAGSIARAQATPKKRVRTVETILSNEEESLPSEVDYDALDITPVSTPARGHHDDVSEASCRYPAAATPSTAFVPDATPGLSVGATPTDESPEAEYHTALRTQTQTQGQGQSQYQHQATAHTFSMSHFQDDDDEDEVFIIDTPSKVPKMETAITDMTSTMSTATVAPSVDIKPLASPKPHTALASLAASCNSTGSALGDYSLGRSSWDTLSQGQSQSQTDFSFDSNDAWTQPDFFHAPEPVSSFPQASFYDDDAAI